MTRAGLSVHFFQSSYFGEKPLFIKRLAAWLVDDFRFPIFY